MEISRIAQARDRRSRIAKAADWIAANVPWTLDASDYPAFRDRWPDMDPTELAEIDLELQRRGEAICSAPDIASATGRSSSSSAAAAWLLARFPRTEIFDPAFIERFAHLTREELLWAAIEHRSLLKAAAVNSRRVADVGR